MFKEQIEEIVKENVPIEWLGDYIEKVKNGTSNSEDENTDFEIQLNSKLEEISNGVFGILALSVIEAKYLNDDFLETAKEEHRAVRSVLESTFNELSGFPVDSINESVIALKEFVDYLIKKYILTVKRISKVIYAPDSKYITYEINEPTPPNYLINKNIPNSKIYSKYIDLFCNKILELTLIDHTLSVSRENITNLIRIHDSYDGHEYPLFKLLDEKCRFLIKKIYISLKENEEFFYSIDLQDQRLSDIIESKFNFLKDYNDVLDANLENNNFKLRKIYEKLLTKGSAIDSKNTVDTTRYFSLVKFYKDNNGSSEQVKNLLKEFKESISAIKEGLNLFDRRAMSTIESYLYNNELSLRIKSGKFKVEDIDDEIAIIKSFQHTEKIYNYFPYYKISCFIIDKIEQLCDSNDVELQKLDLLLNKFNNASERLAESIKWCKDVDFIPYQLSYNDSFVKVVHEEFTFDCFMASSFILPVNYEEVSAKSNELISKRDKFKITLDIYKVHQENKSQILRIKQDIENAEKKNIEILSVFAAIALFAVGSIQIFSKILSMKAAITFILGFAFSLSIFAMIISFLTQSRKESLSVYQKTVLIGILVSAVMIIMYLFFGSDSPLLNELPQDKDIGNK